MTPAPPMQRKAVRRTVIAILAVTIGAIAALAILLGLRLRLAAGDERRQPFDVNLILRRRMLLARLVLRLLMLRLVLVVLRLVVLRLLMLRLVLLRLMVLLLARIERLRLTRRKRLALDTRLFVVVTVVAVILLIAARLLLEVGLGLPQLFLRGGNQAEVMLGVLIIIFSRDRIP
jgi:hypothetical protein